MNNILILFFFLMASADGNGQNQAKIEYRNINFIENYASQDSKSIKKITPGYEISKMIEDLPFVLIFDGSKSVFKIEKRMGVGDKSITHNQLTSMLPETYIDYNNNLRYDYTEISGQTFLVKEKLNVSWKVTGDVRLIKGYRCKKAIQLDENKNIIMEAWFVPDLALNIGPSYAVGLPGLVIQTKQFNNKGEAYSGFEIVDIDFSNQNSIEIPNHETITEKEFTDFMKGSRN